MRTHNSNHLLTTLQQQTEELLQQAIYWQMLPPEKMMHSPQTGAWSAAQCLAHLNSYGNYYLPVLEASITKALQEKLKATEYFKSSRLGNFFTELMLPKGVEKKVKRMKAPKAHMPAGNINSHKTIAEFIEQQEHLLALLEKARNINLRKAKTPISISRLVRLPVGDTFRFLIAHNYRHILQARRAIEAYTTSEAVA